MKGRCHQRDWPAAGTVWIARVITANGRATAAQSEAAVSAVRQGERKTMRSIASAARGSTTALGLQSIAQITSSADAASSLREPVWSPAWALVWRDRANAFSASKPKTPLVTPRSSEIQPTLSSCNGCSAKRSAESRATRARPVSRRTREKQSHALARCRATLTT